MMTMDLLDRITHDPAVMGGKNEKVPSFFGEGKHETAGPPSPVIPVIGKGFAIVHSVRSTSRVTISELLSFRGCAEERFSEVP